MNYYLKKVEKNKKELLFRLLQYSLYEESKNDGNEMNNDGIFEYKYFDLYFSDSSREAYFIMEKDSDKILGFVMINEYLKIVKEGHSIAEFLVLPKYRRNKIGKRVAMECINKYKGKWEISPSLGSDVAYSFWNNVVKSLTKDYRFDEENKIFILNVE